MKLFHCPAVSSGPGWSLSYDINAYGVAGDWTSGEPLGLADPNWLTNSPPAPTETIKAPAQMIAIGDGGGFVHVPLRATAEVWEGVFYSTYSRSISNRSQTIGTVHNQGANMVFLDGHVEWQHWWKWIEFSDAAARRWNYDNQPHEEFWATNSP